LGELARNTSSRIHVLARLSLATDQEYQYAINH
jgi:hypothetical protein